MKQLHRRNWVMTICISGVIAALYVALTCLVGPFGNAVIQCRISEALCVLPFFTSAAIPGLTIGCFVANLLLGGMWQDVLFGTLATLLGALGARALRRLPALVPLPTVLANVLIVPHVLSYAYNAREGVPFLMLTVGIGEVISAYLLGMLLLTALRRHPLPYLID